MYFVYVIFLFGIWDSFSFCTHPFLNAFWHYTDKENVVTQDGTPFWPTVTIYGIVTRMFRSYENMSVHKKDVRHDVEHTNMANYVIVEH